MWQVRCIHLRDLFFHIIPEILEGRREAKISKQRKSLKQRKQLIDEILQSQTKDSIVGLRPAKLQYGLILLMFDA